MAAGGLTKTGTSGRPVIRQVAPAPQLGALTGDTSIYA